MIVSVRGRAWVWVVHPGHVKGDDEGGGSDEREGSFEKQCVGISYPAVWNVVYAGHLISVN